MGWKEITKIPGITKVLFSLLIILVISSVSSTVLLISQQGKNTSGENTLPKNVSLEVARDGLRLKVTGNDTMEALQNLVQIESYLETLRSNEKSSPYIPDLEM